MRKLSLLLISALLLGSAAACNAYNQGDPEFRAFWADAFHSGFKSASEVNSLLANVRAANCNAVVVQMRRRGDTYYPSPYEPWAPDANTSFDALAYLIQQAHNGSPRIEVHAWLCTLPVSTSSRPSNPNHPYNKYPQYLTKDNTGATFDGSNYCFDPGHPEAEQYTYNVFMDVVNRYDVDGIHFDYVRYAGNTWGYNDVSVSRFNARYGRSGQPDPTDSSWKQWRRDQVSNLVRKIYANAIAVKPNIKVSAATITWGNGPSSDTAWQSSSAYNSVFQDWRSWMQEGILDINMPMCYYDETKYPSYYDNWIAYAKGRKYNRQCVIGPGVYLNTITNTIKQLRETRTSGLNGGYADGQVMYSYAVTNNQGLPMSEFIKALTQTSSYDTVTPPIYNVPVSTPVMAWKSSPTKGHIRGTVYTVAGPWADGTIVTITGAANKSVYADGTGFYAFIDLNPGSYTVKATQSGQTRQIPVTLSAGQNLDISFDFCPPTVPAGLQASAVSTSQISLAWSAATDNVAVTGYRVYRNGSVASEPSGTGCSDTGLAPNTQYTYTVSAMDGQNESAQSASLSRYTLSVAPTAQNITCDKAAGIWHNTPGFTFTGSGFGPGGVAYYRYAWDNSPSHTWSGTESQWSSGTKTLMATSGSQGWYLHLRGYNGDNVANGTVNLGPFYYDGDAPSVASVASPMYLAARGSSFDDLRASWSGSDALSGLAEYQYAIGTQPGASDVLSWTSAGTAGSASFHPAEPGGGSYYWSVKARDHAGNWSGVVTSGGSVYASAYATIAEAMCNEDGTPVVIDQAKMVSANFGDYLYVQEPDRSRGIRIDAAGSWAAGSLLRVAGRLTVDGGERRLTAVEASPGGLGSSLRPVMVRISSIGGASPDGFTPGLPGGSGCYNLGLLVTTAGRVISIDSGCFTLSDGSGATVKVYSNAVPSADAFAAVTGVAAVESGQRVIRTRDASDVRFY